MPAPADYDHFDWLVEGRSRNQQATLGLYKIIRSDRDDLERLLVMQQAGQQLLGIAFSLWRAVFLSDLTGDVLDQLADAEKFLESLIAHNTVLYQTDFASREWSFGYYLDNALYRLSRLPEDILPQVTQPVDAGSAKEKWTAAQAALETAIKNFESVIENA